MSDLARYAIFALLDYQSSLKIRNEQRLLSKITNNKRAFAFPIHITLRGRFIAKQSAILDKFRFLNISKTNINFDISLSNPYYHKPELVWRELVPSNKGYDQIADLHIFFQEQIQPEVIEDEVPEIHKNSGFRPHVTLGWCVTDDFWTIFLDKIFEQCYLSKIVDIVLVHYPNDWMKGKKINVVTKINYLS